MTTTLPRKRNLHLSFWLGHIAAIVGVWIFFTIDGAQTAGAILVGLAVVCALWYCISLAGYTNKLGRRGILWGGLAFLLPLAIWITYLASLFIGPTQRA